MSPKSLSVNLEIYEKKYTVKLIKISNVITSSTFGYWNNNVKD